MTGYYDRNGNPIGIEQFGRLHADEAYHRIELVEHNGVRVSTVWLGIDHNYGDGPPVIFESMTFGGDHDGDVERYCTEIEARRGHADMVARSIGIPPTYQLSGTAIDLNWSDRPQRVTRNAEDDVLDAIDELVNESLAPGPRDDYSVNRYDRCPRCHGDWHGLPNELGCNGSDAEPIKYVDQIERVVTVSGTDRDRVYTTHDGPIVRLWNADMEYVGTVEPEEGSTAYTLADIERMRGASYRDRAAALGPYSFQEWWGDGEVPELPPELQFPRPYPGGALIYSDGGWQPAGQIVGDGPEIVHDETINLGTYATNIRFYGVVTEGDEPGVIEGTFEIVPPPAPLFMGTVYPGGNEPAWLVELVEHTISYIQAMLGQIMGIDLSAPLAIEPPLPALEAAPADQADQQQQQRGELNDGYQHVEPLWQIASTNSFRLDSEEITMPDEEPFDSSECEGPF